MANLPIQMLLAQSEGLPPAERKKLMDLAAQEAGRAAAEVGGDALALNPMFQAPGEQGFSLAGNAPVGGAGGIGSALLGNAPPAQAQKLPRLQDTEGWEMYQEAHEKNRKTPWIAPRQVKERNERAMARALQVAQVEMGGSQAQDSAAHKWASLLDNRLLGEREADITKQRLEDARKAREAEFEQGQKELELRQKQQDLQARKLDLAEGRRSGGSPKPPVYKPGPAPAYDVYSPNPTSTGVFSKFAEKILSKDHETPPEEVLGAQVNASRAGGLPRMQSSRKDSPPVVVGPDGKEYWYQNGELVPVTPLTYPNMAPLSPRGPR